MVSRIPGAILGDRPQLGEFTIYETSHQGVHTRCIEKAHIQWEKMCSVLHPRHSGWRSDEPLKDTVYPQAYGREKGKSNYERNDVLDEGSSNQTSASVGFGDDMSNAGYQTTTSFRQKVRGQQSSSMETGIFMGGYKHPGTISSDLIALSPPFSCILDSQHLKLADESDWTIKAKEGLPQQRTTGSLVTHDLVIWLCYGNKPPDLAYVAIHELHATIVTHKIL
ncbi:hypothetical protein DFH28DRAFT_930014 [Melampsora americana]|nr:hypothetical protein DFH28DRAFT_930014 [Melampsora americana]